MSPATDMTLHLWTLKVSVMNVTFKKAQTGILLCALSLCPFSYNVRLHFKNHHCQN